MVQGMYTHVISLLSIFLAGLPSGILSILTGFAFTYSRKMSKMNDLGALVLIEPDTAWERETV